MNKQQAPELSMVASAKPEHVEEVRGTIATYLSAVKANDIATLRGLFDAKANAAHYHGKKDTVVTNTSTSSWASFNRCTQSSTTPRRSARQ